MSESRPAAAVAPGAAAEPMMRATANASSRTKVSLEIDRRDMVAPCSRSVVDSVTDRQRPPRRLDVVVVRVEPFRIVREVVAIEQIVDADAQVAVASKVEPRGRIRLKIRMHGTLMKHSGSRVRESECFMRVTCI